MSSSKKAFTLIEMLVAVSIFSGIVILALGSFARSISSSAKVSLQRERTQAIRSVVDRISTDLQYAYKGTTHISANTPYDIVGGIYQKDVNQLELVLKYPDGQFVHRMYAVDVVNSRRTVLLREDRSNCTAGTCSDVAGLASSDLLATKYQIIQNDTSKKSFLVNSKTSTNYGMVKIDLTVAAADVVGITDTTKCSSSSNAVGGLCYSLQTSVEAGGY
jgi:prepilin-type N-terminal cleavage/methylation domain-containing protein